MALEMSQVIQGKKSLEEYSIYHIQCFNLLIELLYMIIQTIERLEYIIEEELLSDVYGLNKDGRKPC